LLILSAAAQAKEPLDYVDPLIGTDTSLEFSNGNSFPAVSMPFGMTTWTPQTGEKNWLYTYAADRFQGLRATHSPSVWMGDYGSFTLMPMVGPVKTNPRHRAAKFSHDCESAKPHYYKVVLEESGIIAEMSPTMRGAVMRFTFPASKEAVVVFDGHPGGGKVMVLPGEQKIVGYSDYPGYRDVPNFRFHYVLEFDRPFLTHGTWHEKGVFPLETHQKGHHVGAFVSFDATTNREVTANIGTSFISSAQAALNLEWEIGDRNLAQVGEEAARAWNKELSAIDIGTWNQVHKTIFYTALYRALLFPRVFHESDDRGTVRHFSPFSGKVHAGPMYVDTGFWDTYRTEFPLFALIQQDRYGEMVAGFLAAFTEGGWIPKWPSPGYRSVMVGTHGDCVIADALAKGISGFDAGLAFEGVRKSATKSSRGPYFGRVGIADYDSLGWVPADRVDESASRTLAFAYDDFCVAQVAFAAGKKEEGDRFLLRARNYRNLFDSKSGFMRGRNADGSWVEPFDPVEWGGPYTEGAAWHWLWSVQHDIPGLADLLGGPDKLAAQLDKLFAHEPHYKVGGYGRVIHEMREMVAGKMGQYAHANEPVHHVPYLYNYVGQPWKTQDKVRTILETLYGSGPDGYLGDEDNGQMSAWFIMSALGFYPICPGKPIYLIGSPLVTRADVRLGEGKTLRVEAHNNSAGNRYVQKAFLNGVELGRTWFTHQEIETGGELKFIMGDQPDKSWGSSPKQRPPACVAYSAR